MSATVKLEREQVLDFLSGLSVLELNGLVGELEERWGVSAAVAAHPVAPGPVAVAPVEPSTFDVELVDFGAKKLQVIRRVRQIKGLGLRETKELVESAPVVLAEGLERDEAQALVDQMVEAGASARLK